MTTVYTQDSLDSIDTAIATGQLRVKYQDKEVTYRSIAEMMQIRAHIAKQLGRSNAPQRLYVSTSKGLTSCPSSED